MTDYDIEYKAVTDALRLVYRAFTEASTPEVCEFLDHVRRRLDQRRINLFAEYFRESKA